MEPNREDDGECEVERVGYHQSRGGTVDPRDLQVSRPSHAPRKHKLKNSAEVCQACTHMQNNARALTYEQKSQNGTTFSCSFILPVAREGRVTAEGTCKHQSNLFVCNPVCMERIVTRKLRNHLNPSLHLLTTCWFADITLGAKFPCSSRLTLPQKHPNKQLANPTHWADRRGRPPKKDSHRTLECPLLSRRPPTKLL